MFRVERRISVGLLALTCLLLCPAVQLLAQTRDPKLDDLAAQLIANASPELREQKNRSNESSCLVMDFSGPDASETRLDVQLADEFSQALREKWSEMTVLGRSRFNVDLEKAHTGEEIDDQERTASSYARIVGASVVVVGRISEQGQALELNVRLLNEKSKRLAEASQRLELTDSRRALEKLPPREGPTASPWPEIPTVGRNGYGAPKCIKCGSPPFTDESRGAREQGTVLLNVLIGENGGVREVVVIHGLPHGLTEQAVSTVKKWRFEPALGPDGKPAAVQLLTEVNFRIRDR